MLQLDSDLPIWDKKVIYTSNYTEALQSLKKLQTIRKSIPMLVYQFKSKLYFLKNKIKFEIEWKIRTPFENALWNEGITRCWG